ncbi:MAG: hypothetical protein NZ730_06675 [Porticoccaceae bacterium]|nr:hypothetical protein [Porticoccaceae bacterium]
MAWDEIEKASVDSKASKRATAKQRQAIVDLAKAYHRCLSTDDGRKVIEDLTRRFIYINDTAFNSPNINYESAYHNGEAGVVKFIINQMQNAETL